MGHKVKLPNGVSIVLSVLTEDELKALLCVRTTHAQAKQILRRNRGMLRAWEGALKNVYQTYIGCPHCNWNYSCEGCCWQAYPVPDPPTDMNSLNECLASSWKSAIDGDYNGQFCCCHPGITFGGVSYSEVSRYIVLRYHSETLKYIHRIYSAPAKLITSFLKGHTDWARAVLKMPDVAVG